MRIAVAGASGKMGQLLVQEVFHHPEVTLAAAIDQPGSDLIGQDAGARLGLQTGVQVTSDLHALGTADVLIDFTRPEATLAHLQACEAHGLALVLGTTGHDAEVLAALDRFAQSHRLVFAPNMSVGVNIVLKLLEVAGAALAQGYDIEVIEAHHRQKVDAPSGTALKMGEVVARAAGRAWPQDAVYARQGHTGPRSDDEVGFSVIRGGDIVGDHTVLFAGMGERIEITHRSSSRATYAQGAIRAALFLQHAAPGRYDMAQVLRLSNSRAN
ncbi:MAG: 4-hydroxy-tetrahydrodipicolinate reductase [Burkholderiaceae bacterium]